MIQPDAWLQTAKLIGMKKLRIGGNLSYGDAKKLLVSLTSRLTEILGRPFECVLNVCTGGWEITQSHPIEALHEVRLPLRRRRCPEKRLNRGFSGENQNPIRPEFLDTCADEVASELRVKPR